MALAVQELRDDLVGVLILCLRDLGEDVAVLESVSILVALLFVLIILVLNIHSGRTERDWVARGVCGWRRRDQDLLPEGQLALLPLRSVGSRGQRVIS